MAITARRATLRGFISGVMAGLVLVALMYVLNLLTGLSPLPQLLQQPLLNAMPGFVFGFLIDSLQHAGKVVEEAGLIVAMLVGLGVLGGAWGWARQRWPADRLALIFAAVGWVVVTMVLLPLSGAGFLGLNQSVLTPITWGALFAVYGAVLQAAGDPGADLGLDAGRRQMLRLLPFGVAALSLGVLGFRLVPRWYQTIFIAPEAGVVGPSPELTPAANFYVVSKNFGDPVVDEAGWSLSVGGLADHPLKLSLTDLRQLPSAIEFVTLECISNDIGGPLMSTGSFTGVRLRELLALASPQSRGSWAAFKARDGYLESLPLSLIEGAPEILIAYELDGAPLPTSHGFPARVLIPGHYGMKGPKWLDSIDLVDHESGGYWEQQGWDHNAVVKTTSRFDVPRDGDTVKLGPVDLFGVAFSGTRGIRGVECSTDGGHTWSPADFKPALSALTWVLWRASWSPSSEGAHTLQVRAVDSVGAAQEPASAPSYPAGATGYHTIRVDVSRS